MAWEPTWTVSINEHRYETIEQCMAAREQLLEHWKHADEELHINVGCSPEWKS
ncbi:MAG: hypothetical protein ACYTBJ_27260 [Planctomycetota bacterium]